MSPPPSRHRGFSLVLALAVMALLVLVVLSLAGLLSIESRMAAANQSAVQGRLAAIASLRLALAHLQQTAGPDQRVTARADLAADATQPAWTWATIRNPMWTGVWRTEFARRRSDGSLVPGRQEQPPAWLVSGRHDRAAGSQAVSLSGQADYASDQWLPWQSDYLPDAPDAVPIPLVGDASATAAEPATTTDPGRPDGRVTLPRVAGPDGGNFGYAYWIGDEGVKARINLHDSRLDSADARTARGALRGIGRAGAEILPGFESTTPSTAFERLAGHADLPLLESGGAFDPTPPTGLAATARQQRRLRPDTTFWSVGLLTDSFWGGIKVDLSQAFEMDDAAFMASEFGEGSGGASLLFWKMNLTSANDPPVMSFSPGNRIWMPVWWNATRHDVAPLYTHNWDDPDGPRGQLMVRGPTWLLLRDFHRLYRELEWSAAGNATLRARTFFPNVVNNSLMLPGFGGTYHYSHIYNRMDIPNNGSITSDPFVNDLNGAAFGASSYGLSAAAARNGPLGGGSPGIKPVRVAATPYVARQLVVLGIQQDSSGLRITCSPVTVVHNPHNVALALRRQNATDTAAMRLSFRYWNTWVLDFATPTLGPWNRSLQQLAAAVDSSSIATENLRTYIPETVLQPGEFRVYSASAKEPVAFNRIATATNTFDFLGGFWLPALRPDGGRLSLAADEGMTVGLRSQGQFYIRHMMSCWPGDSLMEPTNSGGDAIYNRASEHNELFDSALSSARNGAAPAKVFPAGHTFPLPGAPPQIVAVIDYSMRWPRDPGPFPVFTHSNPLSMITRGDANGWSASPSFGDTSATTSPSYRMTIRSANSWGEVMQPSDAGGTKAYGGTSNESGLGGRTEAVVAGIPLRAPRSLGEYAAANLTMRDQDPLFAVGSSFASPNVPLDKVVHYRTAQNWTDADRAYLANLAVWDRHFLSSIWPDPSLGSGLAERALMDRMVDGLVDGTQALPNARLQVWQGRNRTAASATTPARKDAAVRISDHRQAAAHLVVNGAFNVNSTSVDAWAAILAGTKRVPNGGESAETPSRTANARFARAERTETTARSTARSGWNAAETWSGFATLDDAQVRLLARCIVDEIRFRTQFPVRTPVDRQLNRTAALAAARQYRGATAGTRVAVPTPFLGLSQFVNRFLDLTERLPDGKETGLAQSRAGCLQAAIARAETEGGEITNRASPLATVGRNELSPALDKGPGQQSWLAFPEGVEMQDAGTRSAGMTAKPAANRTHAGLFAPGSVLQQDILAAIGPHLSARSDTFVIRAYGDVGGPDGKTRGRAWVEAIVQRTPDYCHPTNAAEADPGTLAAVNQALGRRFRVIQFRWLAPHEI